MSPLLCVKHQVFVWLPSQLSESDVKSTLRCFWQALSVHSSSCESWASFCVCTCPLRKPYFQECCQTLYFQQDRRTLRSEWNPIQHKIFHTRWSLWTIIKERSKYSFSACLKETDYKQSHNTITFVVIFLLHEFWAWGNSNGIEVSL